MAKMPDRTKELRRASGKVSYKDPLTSFLYVLMRDELPVGKVEILVREIESEKGMKAVYTNGWLAKYAHNLANKLRGSVGS